MKIFKNLFNTPKSKESDQQEDVIKNLTLDHGFVHNFINNKGKFLYCTSLDEVCSNLGQILKENNWNTIICNDNDLLKLLKKVDVKIIDKFKSKHPLFVGCEHLIAENGSILFSSNQLKDNKISDLTENFIVYATTSQIVNTKGESLTGIKSRYKGNIPSNIGAIKNYR